MGFVESAKNGSHRRCFFCHVNDAPLLLLSLDRFPPNFPRTRVQVVARNKWFHIPEKFPLRDRICRKTLFLGYPICDQSTGHVKRSATPIHSFHPLVDIQQMCLSWVTFAEGCIVFQLSTSESVLISNGHTWMGTQSRHQARSGTLLNRPIIFSNITRQVVPPYATSRIADMQWYHNPLHIF